MSDLRERLLRLANPGNDGRGGMPIAKEAADEIASLRAQLAQSEANHGQAVSYLQDQLASARKALETAEGEFTVVGYQLLAARTALRPFAACVFNDNGDLTVTTSDLRAEHYISAKAALTDEEGKDNR